MRTFYLYLFYLINFLRFKFYLKESDKFFIGPFPSILGGKMISFGNSFFANRFLRIEVFGDGKSIKLKIGDRVGVGENVHLGVNNYMVIENDVLIGSRVLITDHNHGDYTGNVQSSPNEPPTQRALISVGPVIIRKNVWIGDGVVVLPGVEIGFGTIIAANSVVTKSIPSFCIAGGIPCKVLKKYNQELKIWEKVI